MTTKSITVLFLGINGWCSRRGCMVGLRVLTRNTALHRRSLAGTFASSPEVNGAEEPGSVKVHGKNVEDSSNEEEEASNQWERIQEMSHHLGSEQKLKNAHSNKTAFHIEAGDPSLEEGGREAGLGEEEDDNLDDIESNNEKCSECSSGLIGNTGVFDVVAILVIFVSDTMLDSLDILCHNDDIGDEDEQQGNHGKTA